MKNSALGVSAATFASLALRFASLAAAVLSAAAEPGIVGNCFFMWVDQPAQGVNRYFPEDSNYGLVSDDGEPYEGLANRMRRPSSRGRRRSIPRFGRRPQGAGPR